MTDLLERPRQPTRHRLDINAYYKMAEAGILTDGQRVQLIDGEIIDLNAVGSAHAATMNDLAQLFIRALSNDVARVICQSPLRLDSYNEPEPDLTILRPREDRYRISHPGAADVLLLIEVSDTSLAYDRETKVPLYAKFGVPEVWIVEITGAAIEIYREPKGAEYSVRERRADGRLSPSLTSRIAIDIGALFV